MGKSWFELQLPQGDDSYEYPQDRFLWRNMENYILKIKQKLKIKSHLIYFSVEDSPFITLCLGSIELDHVISEPCYKRIIL